MCGCNKNCPNCKAASSADGAPAYNPADIASYINKYLYDGKADKDTIQDAYVKVMVWIEDKKLPFTEQTISSNADELKVVVNDPSFIEKMSKKDGLRPGWNIAFVIGAAIVLLYFLQKRS